MQGNGHQKDLEMFGGQLSKVLGCPVHYPAFGKRMFECKCGVLFPVYVVQAAVESKDWGNILKQHEEGYRPTDIAY